MSFATLSTEENQYIQVAGGPGLFMLERHEADGTHYRAFQKAPVASHPDAESSTHCSDQLGGVRPSVKQFEIAANGQEPTVVAMNNEVLN